METLQLDLSSGAEPAPPDNAQYVGFWPRAAARAIDTAFHWIIVFLVAICFGIYLAVLEQVTGEPAAAAFERMRAPSIWAYAFSLLAFVLFGAIAEGLHGSTLGKRLLGMVVLHEAKRPCGFLAALGRQLTLFVDSLFFGIVGAYAMSTSHRDQRYGDRWCKTVVVKRTTVPANVLRSDLRFVGVLTLSALADAAVLICQCIEQAA